MGWSEEVEGGEVFASAISAATRWMTEHTSHGEVDLRRTAIG